MDTEYEIFECEHNGSVIWCDSVKGLIKARRKLRELIRTTSREYFGVGLSTRELIFPVAAPAVARRVFQIAYTESLGRKRAELLRSLGYGVLSVVGNNAAKLLLATLQPRAEDIAFFMIGHAAPHSTRKELGDWLRPRYPKAKIVAFNPPRETTEGADFNVLENGPELWLPIFSSGATGTAAQTAVRL